MIRDHVRNRLDRTRSSLEMAIRLVLAEAADIMKDTATELGDASKYDYPGAESVLVEMCNIAICSKLINLGNWLVASEAYLANQTSRPPTQRPAVAQLAPEFLDQSEGLPASTKQLLLCTDRLSGRVAHLDRLFQDYLVERSHQSVSQQLILMCPALRAYLHWPKTS